MGHIYEQKMFTGKLTKNETYLEILVAYPNNPSEEAIFGRNKIKEKHEDVMLILINEVNRPLHA